MSLFMYISFPKEVDRSCLIDNFDKSKSFLFGEIRGTELEKQYYNMICNNVPENILLPVPIEELPMLIEEAIKTKPDDEWVYLDDDTLLWEGISINSKYGASFNKVFTNQFVYSFMASLKFNINSVDIDKMNEADRSEWQRTINHINDTTVLHRQQLYDIVHLNTKPGEVVEIYSEWVNDNYVFGPPTEVRIIDAEQILTSELLDFNEKLKIEILRSK